MKFTTAPIPEVELRADVEGMIDEVMATAPNPALNAEIKELIKAWAGELQGDAVGLWQIVPALRRGYLLTGADLQWYLRLVVAALLQSGAKPVIGCGPSGYYSWRPTTIFGEAAKEIAQAIASEWANKSDYPTVEDAWFAIPAIYDHPRGDVSFQFFSEEELARLARKR